MTPEEIYEATKDLTPYQVKKWYIDNKITDEDKKAFQNYKNSKNVLAWRQKNKEKYNDYQNSYMSSRRTIL